MSSSDCPSGQTKDASGNCVSAGGRRRTLKAKTLRRMLKKKGMKTTGKKATLMKRLKMKGGGVGDTASPWNGGWDTHGLGGTSYYENIRGS